jgi:UDP-N-acetylmuramoyl-L-alanine---L-glutamate ligase
MTEFIHKQIEGKKVCLLGFGAEGQSSYRTIRRLFPQQFLTISDLDEQIVHHPLLSGDPNVEVITGENYLQELNHFDLILRSPGISFSLLKDIETERLSSQTELFIKAFRMQIIGITGTKGKSTTSSLVHHIILQHTPNTLLVGNIGVPPFEKLGRVDDDTIIVYELSSHQLENLCVSPHVALLLNIFEEHLDHYKSFHHYQLAKYNIAKYQEENDYFIFNADDKNIQFLIEEYIPQGKFLPYSFSADLDNGCMLSDYDILFKRHEKTLYTYDTTAEKNLKGDHNLMNIMAAICACKTFGIPDQAIDQGIAGFFPLEHRIEHVGKFGGVDFYNDSIATIPEATIAAIKSINNVETIILGGLDRGVDYLALMDFLVNSGVNNLIFLGEAGNRMMQLLSHWEHHGKNIFKADNLEDAVRWAKKQTAPEKVCLLSPAAASYDAFKNFAERGTAFKQYVKQ